MICGSLNDYKLNIITDPKGPYGYVTENLFHYLFPMPDSYRAAANNDKLIRNI